MGKRLCGAWIESPFVRFVEEPTDNGGGGDENTGGQDPQENNEGADPKPTETVDYWKKRSRENEQRAKSNADAAKKLKEIEDRDLSDLQKAEKERDEANTELAGLRHTNLVQKVALAKGLTAAQAKRLQGDTEDDLMADADELLSLMQPSKKPKEPDPGQGKKSEPASGVTAGRDLYRQMHPTKKE